MEGRLVSIVIPVYNEASGIKDNLRAIARSLSENGIKHEFVIVDDGSKDKTWVEISDFASTYEAGSVKALRLSRNFGKEAALCAGLEASSGDAAVVMDSDLQHPPSMIPEMVGLWLDEGYDVVEAVKSSRGRESFLNKAGAGMFYGIIKRLSGFNLDGSSDFKLMDQKVIEAWKAMKERNTFFRGMSEWVGYKRRKLPFEVAKRTGGSTKWSFVRLARLAVNAVTSFSSLPLQIVTMLGFIFLMISIVFGVQTLYMKFSGIALSGFTTVILLLLIIGSALMISLGIIGSYIARIYDEVKSRPRYLVSERICDSKSCGGKAGSSSGGSSSGGSSTAAKPEAEKG